MRTTAGLTSNGGQDLLSRSQAAWTVDRALLRPIARAVSIVGVSLEEVLQTNETDGDCTGQTPAQSQIGLADYFFLLQRLTRLTGDETFHLSKRPLLPGTFHFVLSQVSAAANFEDALRRIAKSYNYLYGGTYNHVIRRDGTLIYAIDNSRFPYQFELRPTQSASLMECILILMHFIFILLTSEDLDRHLLKVWTKRKIPASSRDGAHLGIWTAPIRWRSTAYALVYDDAAATLPVALDLRDLRRPDAIYGLIGTMIREREQSRGQHPDWSSQVRMLLEQGQRGEQDVAAALGISERSLRRRLEAEGVTFRDLRQRVLNEHARLLLAQGYLVEEVAEELGYSDARSFRRAFLSWNGVTPNAFRVACRMSDRSASPVKNVSRR